MQPTKKDVRAEAIRVIIVNFLQLIIPVSIFVFWFGGSTTRAWMLGFVWGLFGLSGHPNVSVFAEPAQTTASLAKPPLKLLGHGCRQEYGFQVCEGEVRNDTDQRLENVMVEVKFQDRYGTFVKSESAMINYQPLMPGQTSPFAVSTSNNPQIWHFTIGFRQMFGGELKATR